jgi:hypothetical protein
MNSSLVPLGLGLSVGVVDKGCLIN